MSIIPLYRVDTPHPQAQACAACSVRGQSLFGALDRAGLDYIHASIDSIRLQPGKTLFQAGRGDLIGPEVLLRRPYADDAVACTPAQLCRIPAHLVDGLCSQNPALVRELMLRWQRALEDSEAWLAELATGCCTS